MRNNIPEEYLQSVMEKPQFIERLTQRNSKQNEVLKMAEVVEVLDVTKCLFFDENEFAQKWGNGNIKYAIYYVKYCFKKLGLKAKLNLDNGRVYVWKKNV